MTTEKIDPRAALAKMEAEEKAARDAAEKLGKVCKSQPCDGQI